MALRQRLSPHQTPQIRPRVHPRQSTLHARLRHPARTLESYVESSGLISSRFDLTSARVADLAFAY